MAEMPMQVSIRKIKGKKDLFEFTIATPMLRSQFRLPRDVVNKLRILIEKALTKEQ